MTNENQSPAEGDEFGEFENFACEEGELMSLPNAWAKDRLTGEYVYAAMRTAWRAWKARAALANVQPKGMDGDTVPMPQNADQAAAMALLGERWLRDNAPERLKATQAPAPAPVPAELGEPDQHQHYEVHGSIRPHFKAADKLTPAQKLLEELVTKDKHLREYVEQRHRKGGPSLREMVKGAFNDE